MSLLANLHLFAEYNQTLNTRLYQLASELPETAIKENKGAFFGSIQGTLNHVLVGDILWLRRFAQHSSHFSSLAALSEFPIPAALDQLLYENFSMQFDTRKKLDAIIVGFIAEISADDLEMDLHYHNTKGLPFTRNFGSLLLHFFNHQTHHRGQAATLFSQHGIDLGVTDFLAVIPQSAQPN